MEDKLKSERNEHQKQEEHRTEKKERTLLHGTVKKVINNQKSIAPNQPAKKIEKIELEKELDQLAGTERLTLSLALQCLVINNGHKLPQIHSFSFSR